MLRYRSLIAVLSLCAALLASPSLARTLTFDQRVEARRAIERVYYEHREGVSQPFEQAVSHEMLEAKVRRTLEQSRALEKFWNRPVTGEMLRREMERMARDSRMPERLEELFAALNRDPVLIQECLVRARLVDRLVNGFYAYDDRIHASSRRDAERLWDSLVRGEIDPRAGHPLRDTIELVRGSHGNGHGIELDDEAFAQARDRLMRHADGIGAVREQRGGFVIDVLLSEDRDRLQIARFVVRKTSLDAWWLEVASQLQPLDIPVVASAQADLPSNFGSASHGSHAAEGAVAESCEGGWRELSASMPLGRQDHTAVWTGSEMIVWGGWPTSSDDGERYDPATDSWTPTSKIDAPEQRRLHTAVWTGGEMIIWGGWLKDFSLPTSGGRYDPTTDQWTSTSTVNVPAGRRSHTAVWTGNEMVVWGGMDSANALDTGGSYEPATDTWSPTSTTGAPSARLEHTAVWSGSEMLVWGGGADFFAAEGDCPSERGGRYDPATDTWTLISKTNAPSGRAFHTAAWSGTEMIIWGGSTCSRADRTGFDTGGRYDPSSDSWTATSTTNAPQGRLYHTGTWTGDRMTVWGGSSLETYSQPADTLLSGGHYDPATDTWTATSTANTAPGRAFHTAVWTGEDLIVWGGSDSGEELLDTGGCYRPATDSWTPTAAADSPPARGSAVWTGSEMIVWGGGKELDGGNPYTTTYLDTGSRYDPATDSWTATSTQAAPEGRTGHTAVWTGAEMIVFGGTDGEDPLGSGGRYDPITDGWTATSSTDPTEFHTAVWTGTEMIVWGGDYFAAALAGNRYDPALDAWTPTTSTNAPAGRYQHKAVWSGTEMIVWGGASCCWTWLNDGGRYNPATDTWTSVNTTGAPDGRSNHTAVWTGTEMLVWGGFFRTETDAGNFNDGGRYDPTTDSWTPTSTVDAPSGRGDHASAWTGEELIVWSGHGGNPNLYVTPVETGGRYDPATDSWSDTPTLDSPQGRRLAVAAWTGTEMIVRGGSIGRWLVRDGGALAPSIPDLDADGACSNVDCNDQNADIFPGAGETNDGLDNQCPGDRGFGMVDEIDGNVGFNSSDLDEFSWEPQTGATSYEVARSTEPDFSADCTSTVVALPTWVDSAVPDPGEVFHYLVRPFAPHTGSWGQTSAGTERTVCE